jgi:hypothetical protein
MAGYSVTYSVVDEATAKIEAINKRIRQMREPIERQQRAMQRFVDVSGLRKVGEGFQTIARQAGDAFSSMSRLVPVMGALTGAVSIAGIARLANTFGQFGLTLQGQADQIGTTAQQLQVYQDATRLAGGSADDMTASLKGLTTQSAMAFRGDAQAVAWFQKAGISLTDVNGQLRSSTELLPDVLRYIGSLENPTDRMTAAMGFGGESLANLVRTFERSGQPMDRWIDRARQMVPLTDQQIETQRRYKQAVSESEVAFDHLGQQVGTTMADALTPFYSAMGNWAKDPANVTAVNDLAKAFGDLIKAIDWNKVLTGLTELLKGVTALLKILKDNLGIAEAIATAFAVKWGVGMVGSIGRVVSALGTAGTAGAAAAGGTGLLGALAGIAALATTISAASRLKGAVEERAEEKGISTPRALAEEILLPDTGGRIQRAERRKAEREAAGDTRTFWQRNAPGFLGGTEAPPPPAAEGGGGLTTPQPARGPEPPVKGRYQATAGDLVNELVDRHGLERHQAAGLVGNLGYESGGFEKLQEQQPLVAGSAGGWGYAQWTGPRRNAFMAFAKERGLDPASHEANVEFLNHELSQPQWSRYLDRLRGTKSVEEASRLTHKEYETPQDVLTGTYASGPGRLRYARQAQGLAEEAAARGLPEVAQGAPAEVTGGRPELALAEQAAARGLPEVTPPANAEPAQGAPVEVTGGPPVSGSVDITVTHKNPPPGATVTARGQGDVNVDDPRTEHQTLAAA